MATLQQIALYFFLFVGIYFEVFILFAFFLHRSTIKKDGVESYERADHKYPSVTVIVPCFNEEKTVAKTVDSLLALNYPQDKLKITVVDDGSTDSTWSILETYKNNPGIKVIHKENGGKYTALNLGITEATTDLVGCLDADSFVDKDTLKKIVCRFDDPKTVAVTPAMKIYKPRTTIQVVQSAEYIFGILVKKVMGILGAIHVTPGPFTIFRRSLFKKIGLFRHAHNTEDMEIAFRIQSNHLKIDNVHNAWVYTTGPSSVKKLYKQRVRWTYGFLQNCRDYKYLFFNPKYGNLGILTLPTGLLLIFGAVFSFLFVIYRIAQYLAHKYIEWRTIGFVWPHFEWSFFFVSTKMHIFLLVFVYLLMIILLLNAFRLTEEKWSSTRYIIYYFVIFPLISPFWIAKSVYNAILSKKTSWR